MFDDLFADYPDIKCEEEIDWHDIVDLPGGYEGIETDDTIYRFVNRVSLELDMVFGESTRKQKMKFRKIVNESSELQKFKRAIEAAKKSVIRDVKHHGVSENLGDNELRELRDRLFDIEHDWKNKTCSRDEEILMGKLLDDFEDWVSTYTGRDTYMEADDGDNYTGDTPKIYVGTYAKYNDGSLDGKWVDLTEYNTYEEFVDACRELHSDEDDPEFMVQDYENFPEKWYHEAGLPTEEEFDKINEFYMMDDSKKEAYEVFVNYTGLDSIEDFEVAYEGLFDSPQDFGYYAIDTWGIPDDPESYIDYEAFGRDLTMDWHQGDPDEEDYEGEPEDPEYYYDDESHEQQMPYDTDREVGEQYVDDVGISNMGKDFLDNYFDYDEYGRVLLNNDFWEDAGYVFRNI